MPKTLTGKGQRTNKDTGEVEIIDFSYIEYTSVSDAETSLGAERMLKDLNRMVKTDARNKACAPEQSEEQKAKAKEVRAKQREVWAKLKENPDLAEQLGIDLE